MGYIVDFCCPSEKLVIELDGPSSTVLTFENKFVFQDHNCIIEEIRKYLIKVKINHPGRRQSFVTIW